MSGEVEAHLAPEAERERVRELLGGRPERYLRTYDRMRRTGRGLVFGWSWSGSLFGGAFAFYRRLYAPLLGIEGAATLAAAAALGFAISLGAESGQAMVGISIVRWSVTSFIYGLFGRALVVRDCLERLERHRRVAVGMTLADVPAAWCGPLRRFLTLALATVFGSVLVNIAVDLSTAMRELGGLDESGPPAATKSVPTTALTGIDAVDLPLAILLGASLCLFAAVVLWRRSRRGNLIWPCSGAIAAGVVATAIVGMMPELTPSFRELLSPEWRLLGINFLWIGPVEECCKLILLVWIILAAEPVRNRRGLILAALFMGLGFDIAETAFYLSLPFIPPNTIIARALPRHLLFAVITAAGLCWHAASPRWWKLWLTWLAAALAHASYNVGMLILAANFVPGMPAILDEVVPMFGVAWRALLGSTQLGLGCALLGALVLALAGAAILVRRAWRAEAEEPVSTVLPVAASG